MRKITIILLALSIFVLPLQVQAALTNQQIDSIILLLQAFGVDDQTLSNVLVALVGSQNIPQSETDTRIQPSFQEETTEPTQDFPVFTAPAKLSDFHKALSYQTPYPNWRLGLTVFFENADSAKLVCPQYSYQWLKSEQKKLLSIRENGLEWNTEYSCEVKLFENKEDLGVSQPVSFTTPNK